MVAARLLAAVVDRKTSLDGLTDDANGQPQFRALEDRDRALVRAILATALRFRGTIEALITARLDRPLPANATALLHVLHVGAAQMLFLDIPDSAAVDLAVAHAKSDPRTQRFSGLVNAVLREIGRRKERALPAALAKSQDAPDWFVARLQACYGEDVARAILHAHRIEAPIDLTVKSDSGGWAERLGGIALENGTVRLARLPGPITTLPGFAEGQWWVQDFAAALPARLFGDMTGLAVADLCAAPGGKTAQLAHAGARVTAFEKNPNRAARLASNLERLDLSAQIVVADIFDHEPEQRFDAVLLDAPCSSTGTVRRHPDIPWTKDAGDITKLAELQRRMLERAVEFVRPGGVIVFSNCSLDPQEGEAMVADLLARRPDLSAMSVTAAEMPFAADFLTDEGWLRTTPAHATARMPADEPRMRGMDGFFAARLRRQA